MERQGGIVAPDVPDQGAQNRSQVLTDGWNVDNVFRVKVKAAVALVGYHNRGGLVSFENRGIFNDVTPIRATTTNGITFAATDGSAIITATDSSHGCVVGDFVTISGAVSLGGLISGTLLSKMMEIVPVSFVMAFLTTELYKFPGALFHCCPSPLSIGNFIT